VGSLRRDYVDERWSLRRQLGSVVDGPELAIADVPVPVRRLDALGLDVAFLKVDAEGFELEALRGLAETIERGRPVVLVERSDSFDGVSSFLGAHRYMPFAYVVGSRKLVPYVAQDVANVFFLPEGSRPVATSPPTPSG
jgi:hypothetical protein